jgi:hypothetical protein
MINQSNFKIMKLNIKSLTKSWKLITAISILMITGSQARTWSSADGNKTFEGELTSYDAKTGMVDVTLAGGKKMSFNQKILSTADIKYLTDSAKKPAVSVTKKVKKPLNKKQPTTKKSNDFQQDEQSFIFFPYPKANAKKPWNVRNFGPVGIGMDLTKPNLTMVISNVEEGSPAAKSGKLKKGQIIESINGQTLGGKDAREILGDIINQAEATDGKISLDIKGEGNVLISIPVMGSYSKTWPVDCSKSDKIVRKLADYLATQEKPGWGAVLFMLSTGEEKDLKVVRKWMKGIETIGAMNWEKGFKGHGLCEYYLRTGDQKVIPVIKKMTEELKGNVYRGTWSGRGGPAHFGYGPLQAAGTPCATFLVMARLCGVEVDEYMFSSVMKQFYRYAGHGTVSYGDGAPEDGFRDNGKTGALAMTMAAAALLTPEGENSVYAKARDNSAMKSFYATNWFHAAHTGGGIGEIWHHKTMSMVRDKRPIQYRSYMDTRRWVMELSRRFDGTIGIAGMSDRYDRSASEGSISWGNHFALTYTIPRKHLQMFGAPRSKWAKHYQLPERFWGNKADDIFQSVEPAKHPTITMEDILKENVVDDASWPVLNRLGDPSVTDDTLLKYLHHPEFGLRLAAIRTTVKLGRHHLVLPLLKSDDARLRYNGILAITGMYKGRAMPSDQVTPEMFNLVGEMIENPEESWWVVQGAIKALATAEKATIVKHLERLIALLESDSIFIQQAAVIALNELATDPDYYKRVLPLVATYTIDDPGWGFAYQSYRFLSKKLKLAKPEVKEFARTTFKKVFEDLPDAYEFPGGVVLQDGPAEHRKVIGKMLTGLPGDMGFILKFPKKTVSYMQSKKDADMYAYSGKFEPDESMIGTWKWVYFRGAKFNSVAAVEAKIAPWVKEWKAKGSKSRKSNYGFEFSNGGKVKALGYTRRSFADHFWTKGMLIGKYANQAVEIKKLSHDGIEFIIVSKKLEVEDLTISGEDDVEWKPSYSLYMKDQSSN